MKKPTVLSRLRGNGGWGQNRTADTRIFSGIYPRNGYAAIRNILNKQEINRSRTHSTAVTRTQFPLSVTEKCQKLAALEHYKCKFQLRESVVIFFIYFPSVEAMDAIAILLL